MKTKFLPLLARVLAALLLAAGLPLPLHANRLVNGDFESPVQPVGGSLVVPVPWDFTGGGGAIIHPPYSSPYPSSPQSGAQYELVGSGGSIAQAFSVDAGAAGAYQLTWFDNTLTDRFTRYNVYVMSGPIPSATQINAGYVPPIVATAAFEHFHGNATLWNARSLSMSLPAGDYFVLFSNGNSLGAKPFGNGTTYADDTYYALDNVILDLPPVSITTSASPTAGGSTSGGGAYSSGASVTVVATPNPGYSFQNWTEGGTEVSVDLSFNFIASVNRTLVAHFATCVSLPPCGVAWWRAEGNALDAVGAHHGSPQGAAAYAPGKVGQAFSFDGADGSYVSVPESPAWDLGSTFTIEFWVKLNEIKTSMFIHQESESGPPASGFEFDFQPGSAGLAFARDQSHGMGHEWSPPPEVGIWYHLAVTRQSDGYRVYVNGVQQGALDPSPDPVTDKSGPLRIGSYAAQSGYGVNGLIDELSIYSCALSAAELQAIFNAGSAGKCPPCGNDTFPPIIHCPSNITVMVDAGQCSKSNVTYVVTATDNCSLRSVLCSPPSGSTFPIGVTVVNCTATDAATNVSNCSFTVTVSGNCAPTNCSANLLVNGSFEDPGVTNGYVALPGGSTYITGWTTYGGIVQYYNPVLAPDAVNSGVAADGNYLLNLGRPSVQGLSQTFATVPGQIYKVSFAMGTSKEPGRTGYAQIGVGVVGIIERVYSMTTASPTIEWKRHHFSFTASASSTTLYCYTSLQYNTFVNLDDVRVTDCPEAFASFSGFGYTVLGGASVQVSSNQLFVSNFGTQGTAGVRLDLSGFQSGTISLAETDSNSLPAGGSITMSAFGEVNGNADSLISSLRATRVGNQIEYSAYYTSIGAVACTALLYDGSTLVAQAFDLTGVVARVTGPTAGDRWTPALADRGAVRPWSVAEFPSRPLVALSGGQPVACTRLMISPQANRVTQPSNPIVTPTYTLGWPKWLPWYQPGPYGPPWRYPGDPGPNETPAPPGRVFIGSLTRFEVVGHGAGTLRIVGAGAGIFGSEHQAVGGAQLNGASDSFLIEPPTLYTNQTFGVDIFAGGASEWDSIGTVEFDASWLTPQPDIPGFALPIGASLKATLTGSLNGGTNQLLAAIEAVKTGSNTITIQGSFNGIGSAQKTMEIWNGSTLAYSIPTAGSTNGVTVGYWPLEFGGVVTAVNDAPHFISPPCSGPGCPNPTISFHWSAPFPFTVPGLTNDVIGDRIRFVAGDPNPRPNIKLDHISLLLSGGLQGLQVISEHAVPSGQFFAGLAHLAIGPASLTVSSNDLAVTNLGTNADFGASVALGSAPFAEVGIVGPDSTAPEGSEVRVKSYGALNGVPDQLLGAIIASKLGTNLQFSADITPLSLPTPNFLIYDGPAIVAAGLLSNTTIRIPNKLQLAWLAGPWRMFRPGAFRSSIELSERTLFALSGQLPVFGTRVEFQACWICGNPSPQPSLHDAPSLSRVDLVGHGLPGFRITRERLGLLAQPIEPVGLSHLLGIGKELRVHNLLCYASNPLDSHTNTPCGIAFALDTNRVNNVAVWFRPPDPWGVAPTGAILRATAQGLFVSGSQTTNMNPTMSAQITHLGAMKDISTDYSQVAAASRLVEVLRSNTIVFTASLDGATGIGAHVSDWPIAGGVRITIEPTMPVLCFWWRWWPETPFLINNQIVSGDEIRILAGNMPVQLAHLTQFSLRAAGVPEIQLTAAVAEQPGPIMAKVQRFGDTLAFSWEPPNLRQALQSADTVAGPWTDVPGVTVSPYVTAATGTRKFFRVSQP